MKKKNYLILDEEFIQYCQLNQIDDVEKYAKDVFKKGFTLIKYGEFPEILGKPVPPPTKLLYEGIHPDKQNIVLPSKTEVKLKKSTKEEINMKWENSGFLDGLKGHTNMDISLYESNVKQVIPVIEKTNKDIYDE